MNDKKIRLSDEDVSAIVEIARQVFGRDTRVYLFGSRTDPGRRGGDIDLCLRLAEDESDFEALFRKKMRFLVELEKRIGERRVDVILSKPSADHPDTPKSPVERAALASGVELICDE